MEVIGVRFRRPSPAASFFEASWGALKEQQQSKTTIVPYQPLPEKSLVTGQIVVHAARELACPAEGSFQASYSS